MDSIYQFDRRNQDRLTIPSSKILFPIRDGQLNNPPLIDISKSSVRFRYLGNVSKGDNLSFDPIVFISKDNANHKEFVVVQIAPFGTDERYNTSKSHAQLSDLFENYKEAI